MPSSFSSNTTETGSLKNQLLLAKQIEIAWPNIIKMLIYRGYNATLGMEIAPSIKLKHLKTKKSLMVFCDFSQKLDVKKAKSIQQTVDQEKVKKAIIFYWSKTSPSEKQLKASKATFELFKYSEMNCCVVEHDTTSEIKEILDKKETLKMCKKDGDKILDEDETLDEKETLKKCKGNGWDIESLPKIKKNDPIAKFYGLSVGMSLNFERHFPGRESGFYVRALKK